MARARLLMIALSTGIAMAAGGCGDEDDASGEGAKDATGNEGLIPLALGNEWHYTITAQPGSGKSDTKRTAKSRINGLFVIDGKRWYYNVDELSGDVGDYAFFLRYEDGFILESNLTSGLIPGEPGAGDEVLTTIRLEQSVRRFAKYPAKVGDVFEPIPDPPPNQGGVTVRVTSVDEEVVVPAGTFRCVVYEVSDGESSKPEYTWYNAPGTGIVKGIQPGAEDGTKDVRELEKFVPAS